MVAPTTIKPPPVQTNGATPPTKYDPEYDPAYLRAHYPPNEEPMAEAARFLTFWLDMMWPLFELFGKLPNTFINGNVFIYYRVGGELKWIAPDLIVSFSVDTDLIRDAGSYFLWAMGKPPEFVMEIGSASTADRDLTEKLGIYARIGAREYWLFDPPDGSRYKFILKGLRLVNGRYEEIPMTGGEGDDIRGYSDALGLYLCWEDGAIRFYDPVSGEYLKNQEETIAERDAAIVAVADRDSTIADRDSTIADREAEIERLRALLDERDQA